MSIELPALPYDLSALQPHISSRQLGHHRQLHEADAATLRQRVAGTRWEEASLEVLLANSQGLVFELVAQTWNRQFHFQCLRPRGGGDPQGLLGERIRQQFGDAQVLRDAFNRAALSLFGSGWVWLVVHADGSLAVQALPNAGTPLTGTSTPLLACPVWEHAYYLDYRNERGRWLEAFWAAVNWEFADTQLQATR